jgi:pimeloyl-ACP methyl ester carboxylesterase
MILNVIEAGEGPPVMLLHGLFGMARNFGTTQRALAQPQPAQSPLTRHFRVLALDMRNHGASPHQDGMRYPDMAEDVRQTMLAHGIDQAAIVGHSMGGKAAMALALQWPEMVSRLLVSDIAPVRYVHHNEIITAALMAIPLDPALTRQQADAMLTDAVPQAAVRAFLLQNFRFGRDPGWRIGLPQIAAAIPDLEGWVDLPGAYEGPSLFVTGAESHYVLAAHRPAIRALFPQARFVAIKHAGHWVHADNPAGFQSVLDAFLTGWA